MSSQLPRTKLAADGITPMVSKPNKKELKLCLDERGLDYISEASNAALQEILLAHLKRLKDSDLAVSAGASLETLAKMDSTTLALQVDALIAKLDDPDFEQRYAALEILNGLEPATLALHAEAVVAKGLLKEDEEEVRHMALTTLQGLDQAVLTRHADVIVWMLEDPYDRSRGLATQMMGELEPETLAQHADAVVAMMDDEGMDPDGPCINATVLLTLGSLKPAKLAQHAAAVAAKLESNFHERRAALETLAKLEPAALAQYAEAVIARLEDSETELRIAALDTLSGLPRYITRGIDFDTEEVFLEVRSWKRYDYSSESEVRHYTEGLSSRLLGRLRWYRCRLRLRVKQLALYWIFVLVCAPVSSKRPRPFARRGGMGSDLHERHKVIGQQQQRRCRSRRKPPRKK